jgi:iron complex transport system permease protein
MNRSQGVIVIVTAVFVLAAAALVSLCVGAAGIPLADIGSALFAPDSVIGRIIWVVRVPRLLAAILAGAGLSVSGVILQTVLSNPLAAPGVIGVNAGAGLLTTLCAALIPGAVSIFPAAAFAGAMISVLLVYGIAHKTGASRLTLILSGVAVSALMTAGTNTLLTLYPHLLSGIHDFQNGGFSGVSLRLIARPGVAILTGLLLTFGFSGELEILGLGEDTARSLGLKVRLWRVVFLILAAALAGCAVSFAGLIGFVGLIAPHMSRLLLRGSGKRAHIVLSALIGAILLVVCDTLSRTLFAPYELPVGILISFLGAPFFLWLIYRERRKRRA